MKKTILFLNFFMLILVSNCFAQITDIAPEGYKVIDIGTNGYGDYTKSVILLHEIYNGTKLGKNYAVGEIRAIRGSSVSNNRTNVVFVNTSSAYTQTYGSLISNNHDTKWKLVTVTYNGKKYIAVVTPYRADYNNHGFNFFGSTTSTGENMKIIAYENSGSIVNSEIVNSMQDFTPNMSFFYDANRTFFSGQVGIGDVGSIPNEAKLIVKGSILATEVKVKTDVTAYPDFVFDPNYNLPPLQELDAYIQKHGHLPKIPTAKEVGENGISLGEMNTKLLEKIEELTIYVIEQDKKISILEQKLKNNGIN